MDDKPMKMFNSWCCMQNSVWCKSFTYYFDKVDEYIKKYD